MRQDVVMEGGRYISDISPRQSSSPNRLQRHIPRPSSSPRAEQATAWGNHGAARCDVIRVLARAAAIPNTAATPSPSVKWNTLPVDYLFMDVLILQLGSDAPFDGERKRHCQDSALRALQAFPGLDVLDSERLTVRSAASWAMGGQHPLAPMPRRCSSLMSTTSWTCCGTQVAPPIPTSSGLSRPCETAVGTADPPAVKKDVVVARDAHTTSHQHTTRSRAPSAPTTKTPITSRATAARTGVLQPKTTVETIGATPVTDDDPVTRSSPTTIRIAGCRGHSYAGR